MGCDIARLVIAVDAARERIEGDWRQRWRIGGFEVEEPVPEPQTDEEFNAQIRMSMAAMKMGS